MTDEAAAIQRSTQPVTARSLVDDLLRLGDLGGRAVLVHSSLSALGWVAGGAQAVVEALLGAVGPEGTLVVPTHSGHLTDPCHWRNPPVPEEWWELIREATPAFDPLRTPSREMGAVAEIVRSMPGARRSPHPSVSFAALGPLAGTIIDRHPLEHGLDDGSPLGRLYDLDALVLLLGIGHANNTSLHLAELRADLPGREWITQGSPVVIDGVRRWATYPEPVLDADDFEACGADLPDQTVGPAGAGEARLMPQRDLVDFATVWFTASRGGTAA